MTKPAAATATDVFADIFARAERDRRRPKVDATDDLAGRMSYDRAVEYHRALEMSYSPRWHRIYLASQPVLGYATGWRS